MVALRIPVSLSPLPRRRGVPLGGDNVSRYNHSARHAPLNRRCRQISQNGKWPGYERSARNVTRRQELRFNNYYYYDTLCILIIWSIFLHIVSCLYTTFRHTRNGVYFFYINYFNFAPVYFWLVVYIAIYLYKNNCGDCIDIHIIWYINT